MTDAGFVLVTQALQRGVCVVWDPPRFRGPVEVLALLKETPEFAREVLRRAAIFKEQIRVPGLVPFLVIPGMVGFMGGSTGGCLSCGVPVSESLRCAACRLAAWLALGLLPPADGGPQ